MVELIVLILGCVGLTYNLMYSPLIESPRNKFKECGWVAEKLITCPACCGTWVGIIGALLFINGLVLLLIPMMISIVAHIAGLYFFV